MIKTFRGLLADGGQDRIRLQTIKGKVGYKIIKLAIIGNEPGAKSQESLVKIYKNEQSTFTDIVDFTDSDLLAVSYWAIHPDPQYGEGLTGPVIFDNEVVNQDIYVSHTDVNTGESCNYYLELEVIPLDDKAAEYTIIKDIRTATSTI